MQGHFLKRYTSTSLCVIVCTVFFVALQEQSASSGGKANPLGLANVGGIFVVLIGGAGVACVLALCEFLWETKESLEEGVRLYNSLLDMG